MSLEARITLEQDELLHAALSDGRVLVSGDARELAMRLVAAGVEISAAHCGDWREGESFPSKGTAIAIKYEMMKLQRGVSLLFLDIDGVLRPFQGRHLPDFPYLRRFENVLRSFTAARVVITSTLRETMSLDAIREWFSKDIQDRIIGCTPVHELKSGEDHMASRYREIMAYLNGLTVQWVALDDDSSLYPRHCRRLILCDDGFRVAEESALRHKLETYDWLRNAFETLGFSWNREVIPPRARAGTSEQACFHLQRNSPEFVWRLGLLEGLRYSYLEVKTLLEGGAIQRNRLADHSKVRKIEVATQILVDLVRSGKFVVDKSTYDKLYGKTPNRFDVEISNIFWRAEVIFDELTNPIEKAVVCYLCLFEYDHPTAFLMTNGILMQSGLLPICIVPEKLPKFREMMIGFKATKEASGIMRFLSSCIGGNRGAESVS